MSEKLIIKNFGPIKHIELELKKFNVLIGEQATGKSTVAKVLAVCRYFSYILEGNNPLESPFGQGLINWGLTEFVQQESFISYQCKHYSFTAQRLKVTLEDDSDLEYKKYIEDEFPLFKSTLKPLSKEFDYLLTELNKLNPKSQSSDPAVQYLISSQNWNIPTSFYQNEVANVLDNPFYFPAERGLQSIFSLGKSSIQNISDSLFNQFAQLDQIARLFKKDTVIEPLNITYKNVEGKGFVRKNNEEKFYSLYNAATGYQSTIPVVLVIKYYNEIRKKNKTFIIEEPELNLFPAVQQKLLEYVVDKGINYGNTVLLTTHSPYTLTVLNNLMYAYQVGQDDSGKTNAIIEKKYWLNPDDVSAYKLLANGTCENIIDEDIRQIKTEAIDEISEVISDKWHELVDVKYEN